MQFVQIIEFQTHRLDEFNATLDEWIAQSEGWRGPTRAQLCRDRQSPNRYVNIVEFPSYEKAMENSSRPETAAFAARLAALCDGDPLFRDFDVVREEQF